MRSGPPLTCVECGVTLYGRRLRYCSRECEKANLAKRYRGVNPPQPTSNGTTGAIAELVVAADLMRRGYDVFRALSPSCSCDLAIVQGTRFLRVEVRTAYRKLDGTVSQPNPKPTDAGRQDVWAQVVAGEVIYVGLPDKPVD